MFEAGGDCGVAFFLILSGFVMSIGYSEKVVNPDFNYRQYLRHRIIRIYPIHLLCLLGYMALTYRLIDLQYLVHLIPNLLLLQSWSTNPDIYFSGNAVSWCLSDLLFFYAAFPLIIKFRRAYKRIVTYILLSILTAYFILINYVPENLQTPLIYINPSFRIIDFIIGIVLYEVYIRMNKNQRGEEVRRKLLYLLEPCSILVLILFIIVYGKIPQEYSLTSYWWLPVGLIIIVFSLSSLTGKSNGRFGYSISRILNLRPLVVFGNASFSFYMIHVLNIRFLSILLVKFQIVLDPYLKLLVILAITILASIIVYKYIERPVSNYLLHR